MELNFDIRGNLHPYEIIQVSFKDFKKVFVDSFESDSTRQRLFEKYLVYLNDLQQILGADFFQWIDGSFVSTKYNPKDIDLLTVIHYQDYEKNIKEIEKAFSGQNARKLYEVDAYVMGNYPQGHTKYRFTQSDLLYWRSLFGTTRVSRSRRQFRKGFVQINFISDGR